MCFLSVHCIVFVGWWNLWSLYLLLKLPFLVCWSNIKLCCPHPYLFVGEIAFSRGETSPVVLIKSCCPKTNGQTHRCWGTYSKKNRVLDRWPWYGPKVCSTYLRINGYTILGCWLDVCYVGYFMGYTYHWMYGCGVFLDLQEQPLHIVFRQSVTKPSITSTQTVIAIMEGNSSSNCYTVNWI